MGDVLAAFAAEIGTAPPTLTDGAPVAFRFERSGRLFVEARDERILVYLEYPEPVRAPAPLVGALAACDPRRPRAFPMRAGLSADDRLVMGVVVEEQAFTLPALHQIIEQLMQAEGEIFA
jgi:type III secretion system chaperone SycN